MTTKPMKKKRGRPRKLKSIVRQDTAGDRSHLKHNFIDLNPNYISEHQEVKSLVDHVYKEMIDQGFGYTQKKYNHKLRDHLRMTLLTLCLAYFSDASKSVRIYRDKNRYNKDTVPYKLHIKYPYLVTRVIPFLKEHGYIEEETGHHFFDSSFAARIWATKRLMKLVVDYYKVKYPMIKRDPDKDILVLKGKKYPKIVERDGKEKTIWVADELDYPETSHTLKLKENIKLINRVLDQNVILLEITNKDLDYLNKRLNDHKDPKKRRGGSVDFTQTQVRRVFNNESWEQGGRFYGGFWQRIINKEDKGEDYRKSITINDMPIWEADYKGLHINMLYAMEKLPMPEGDVYYLDGYSNDSTFRRFVKRMLLIMVNTDDREKVRQALHEEVHRGNPENRLALPEEIGATTQEAIYPVIETFEKKHSIIAHKFCIGAGIDLQYEESQLAEQILLHFARQGKPCLPIHDSFIVEYRHRDELVDIMKKAFQDRFGKESGVKIDTPMMFENIKWALEKYQEGREGKYTQRMREKDDEWIEIMYSRYNQLVAEFAEVKGVKLPEPDAVADAEIELLKQLEVMLILGKKMSERKKIAN
jgi:hypothetical protein